MFTEIDSLSFSVFNKDLLSSNETKKLFSWNLLTRGEVFTLKGLF